MKRKYWLGAVLPIVLTACSGSNNGDDCINGYIRCDGQCVNPKSSHDNCGQCGNACGDGEYCISGLCDTSCASPNTICGADCVDLKINDDYCGDCNTKCVDGARCVNGICRHDCPVITDCSWCAGDAITDENGCTTGYICANGVNSCETKPCTASSGCQANEECEVSTGLCWPAGLPANDCSITITYANNSASSVYLAGEFNNWDATALKMENKGNGIFEATLSGNEFEQGALYGYKPVLEGTDWVLDDNAPYRKYIGEAPDTMVNSAFRFPMCDLPEIEVDEIATNWTGDGGTFSTQVKVRRSSTGATIKYLHITVDGQPATFTLDDQGVYQVSGTVKAGRHVLSVRVSDAANQDAEPVDAIFWLEEKPFNWNEGVLYLLFIDRFANGDTSNDKPLQGPVNWAADWHGGDLLGAQKVLESGYFEKLGVKAIWLSPVNAQVEGYFVESGGSHQIAPYHGYWPVKAREVEGRFGGNAALKSFVEAAHKRGIRVLLDLINNQVHEQHEYVSAHPDWFRTGCVCGTSGCGWSEKPLECLFTTYLPDINWLNEECADQFIDDAANWIAEFGVDGFRVDAVKHVEINSIYNMRAKLNQRFEQGGTRLVMIGETAVGGSDSYHAYGLDFNNGYEWIMGYTGLNALDGQFDFPTYHALNNGGILRANMSFYDVESTILAQETNYSIASKAPLHVSYLGSHDTNRIISRAYSDGGDGDGGCKWDDDTSCHLPVAPSTDFPLVYANVKNAWTLLWTMPFMPLLYNGDEVAVAGGNDPDNRRDMVFTDDLAQYNNTGIEASSLNSEQLGVRSWLEKLAKARQDYPVLTTGYRKELYLNEKYYVYARYSATDTAIVVINNGAAVDVKNVIVTAVAGNDAKSTSTWETVVGEAQATAGDGYIDLHIPANSSSIIILK